MRDKLLETERVEALQEEIAGFLLDQVINPKGEYYYPLPPPWKPLPIVIVLRRHQLGYNAIGSEGNAYVGEIVYSYTCVYVWIN